MTDVKLRDREASGALLYLRDEELGEGIELLYFAYRDFTAEGGCDPRGVEDGRAHHRALHFIARNPGITIMELLKVLSITKQSLGRVLNELTEGDLVATRQGTKDKRFKHLTLTDTGADLERRLSSTLKRAIGAAYRSAARKPSKDFAACSRG